MRRLVLNMRDERPIWSPPAWVAARIRDTLPPDWELVEVAAPVTGSGDGGGVSAEALIAIRGAEAYLGMGLPKALLAAALEPPCRLRWVHSGAAGVASLLHPELRLHEIVLTNSAGIHGPPMAESVLGMILYFARGFDHAVRARSGREWGATAFQADGSGVREVAGATLGIIGLGGVGREVARRARALGMDVLAIRRRPDLVDDAEVLHGDDALDRLLALSDYVVVTAPSTSATRGLIDAERIARMRPGSVFINVARGDLVDEVALIDALRRGHLRGAALDVFRDEPLPPSSALWDLDNVLITPHVSATTPHFWERETELLLENLRRYLAGRALRNTVDPDAGY
ncbi:MAG TPA: D-2-hydroxyacid dehydrogenase [Longimicrobiales bacterium]|nr:D-2-hydroxyacid dehydrogenase [Longimicrobiales bacterium]